MSATGFEFKDPYRQNVYMGAHVDDLAVLAYIRLQKWDSAKDGTGFPEEGMIFFDETLHAIKVWDANAGAWRRLIASGQTGFDFDPVPQSLNSGVEFTIDIAAGYTGKFVILNGGGVGDKNLNGINLAPHPPQDGAVVCLFFNRDGNSADIVIQNDDAAEADPTKRFVTTSSRPVMDDLASIATVGQPFTNSDLRIPKLPGTSGYFVATFIYALSKWHVMSHSRTWDDSP